MSELLERLLHSNNRKICRIIGLFFTTLPLIFFFAGSFSQGTDGKGIIFSSGWFREIFVVLMVLMFMMGLILDLVDLQTKKDE